MAVVAAIMRWWNWLAAVFSNVLRHSGRRLMSQYSGGTILPSMSGYVL